MLCNRLHTAPMLQGREALQSSQAPVATCAANRAGMFAAGSCPGSSWRSGSATNKAGSMAAHPAACQDCAMSDGAVASGLARSASSLASASRGVDDSLRDSVMSLRLICVVGAQGITAPSHQATKEASSSSEGHCGDSTSRPVTARGVGLKEGCMMRASAPSSVGGSSATGAGGRGTCCVAVLGPPSGAASSIGFAATTVAAGLATGCDTLLASITSCMASPVGEGCVFA